LGGGVIIALATGDDMNFMVLGQIKGQVRQQLTGGGLVGVEVAVEENELGGLVQKLDEDLRGA
jgi:hypothetical protein